MFFSKFLVTKFRYQKKMFWNVTTECSCRSFAQGFISEVLVNHICRTINNPQFSLRTTSACCKFMLSRFLARELHHLHMTHYWCPLSTFWSNIYICSWNKRPGAWFTCTSFSFHNYSRVALSWRLWEMTQSLFQIDWEWSGWISGVLSYFICSVQYMSRGYLLRYSFTLMRE